ncbi:transposase-like protein [Rhizobium sp. BK650]|nr:transposase-like protein [Rhizobium sp. BK650]
MRNVLAHAGKSGRRVVSAFIATAFAQEMPEAASAQWRAVAYQIRQKVPKLAAIMDDLAKRSVGINSDNPPHWRLLSFGQWELRATRQLRIRALGPTGRVAEAASY